MKANGGLSVFIWVNLRNPFKWDLDLEIGNENWGPDLRGKSDTT